MLGRLFSRQPIYSQAQAGWPRRRAEEYATGQKAQRYRQQSSPDRLDGPEIYRCPKEILYKPGIEASRRAQGRRLIVPERINSQANSGNGMQRLPYPTVPSIVKGAKGDNKIHITCQPDFTGERPTTISKTESEQQLKEKEAKLFADDKASASAEAASSLSRRRKEFTAKHQTPRRAQRRRLIVPERINWDPEKYDGLLSRRSKDTAEPPTGRPRT